jgi:hypothetical protein
MPTQLKLFNWAKLKILIDLIESENVFQIEEDIKILSVN